MKKKSNGNDKRVKSVAKAFSWRVIATVTTAVLVYLFTGTMELAIGVGFFDFTIKLLLYYGHERIWNKVPLQDH